MYIKKGTKIKRKTNGKRKKVHRKQSFFLFQSEQKTMRNAHKESLYFEIPNTKNSNTNVAKNPIKQSIETYTLQLFGVRCLHQLKK